MKIATSDKSKLRTSLVLSLQRDAHLRNYYLFSEKRRRQLILMEETSNTENEDTYTIFHSWEDALKDMNKFETAIAPEKRWWSYCPGWMYFNPEYIHQGLKKIFSNIIARSLNDILDSDVAVEEKERFNLWVETCNLQTGLLH